MEKTFLFLNFLALFLLIKSNDYYIIIDWLKLDYRNPDVYEKFLVTVNSDDKINISAKFEAVLKQDLNSDIEINMQLHQLQSDGTYKVIAEKHGINYCEVLANNDFGIGEFFLKTGNVTLCPWKANTYATDFVPINILRVPENFPPGNYKSNIQFYKGDTKLLGIKCAFKYINKH